MAKGEGRGRKEDHRHTTLAGGQRGQMGGEGVCVEDEKEKEKESLTDEIFGLSFFLSSKHWACLEAVGEMRDTLSH